jgi:hypothetical protein
VSNTLVISLSTFMVVGIRTEPRDPGNPRPVAGISGVGAFGTASPGYKTEEGSKRFCQNPTVGRCHPGLRYVRHWLYPA